MANSSLWAHSLRGRGAFSRVRRHGRRLRLDAATFHSAAGTGPVSRLGIVLPKSVGGAVRRNRIRRVVRAWAWAALGTLQKRDAILHFHRDPGAGLPRVLAAVETGWTR